MGAQVENVVCNDVRSASISIGRALASRIAAFGRWRVACHSPFKLTDPELFKHFCDRQRLVLPAAWEQGVLTAKEFNAYVLVAQREFRKAFDKLLFGGDLRWITAYNNLVVNEGLDHLLDVTLSGGSQDTSWFVGLLGTSPSPAAGHTATDIAGYDFVAYDESSLPAWVDGGVSSQSVSNAGSPAEFTISTDSSVIGGAYLIGTNAKATPAGTLYAAGAFEGGDKAADDGDTLSVTAEFGTAAA